MIDEKFLQKALDTGSALGIIHASDGLRPYYVRPPGYDIQPVGDDLLAAPWRLRQQVLVFDPKSFTDYFTDYCKESSRIFVDMAAPTIVGVLDYHEQPVAAGEGPLADWCQHRLIYYFRHTREWEAWMGKNRAGMKQIEFARFIEDNLLDIAVPTQAEMLQISRTMELKKNVNFSSGVRLQNGEIQLAYTEEIRGTAAQGTMEIPEIFRIKIAPFEGSEEALVDCRLRYSLKEGNLEIRYEMVRPHKVIEAAVARVVELVRGAVTNPITYGTI